MFTDRISVALLAAALSLSVHASAAAAADACSAERIGQRDYRGQTLRVLSHQPPVMGEPVATHSRRFAELTGAGLVVTQVPFGELYDEVVLPLLTGEHRYDVLFYSSLWIADVAPYLQPIPQAVLDGAQMREVTGTYREVATWDGRMVQFPVDGDRHYFKYRISPFENPEYQRRFEAEYGRPLAVPDTWEDYAEVAKFFSGWDWDGDGEVEYGAAEVTSTDDMMVFSSFLGRAAAYAKHPGVSGGFFFDLQSMTPLVNNPGWVRALENFIEAAMYMPPGGEGFTIADEIESYGGGQVLFSNSWDDATARATEPGSDIRDDLGFSMPMGSHEVWNRETGQWDRFDEPNRIPYIAWGWTAGVSAASPEVDLAFEYLCFFKNRENHERDLSRGQSGVNPHRERDFEADFYVQRMGWKRRQAQSYAKTLKAVDQSPQRIFDLRVPGGALMTDSMVRGIAAAKSGEMGAQQALDRVVLEWREIVADVGLEAVRKAYAAIVAIEDGVNR